MSAPTQQEIANNIFLALSDATSTGELRNLAAAILDPAIIPAASKNALADALSRESPIQDAINTEIAASLRVGGPIAAAIAGAPGGPPMAPMAPMAPAPAGQINGRVPCGTPADLGDGRTRVVRAGYCFPDEHNGCNGSILADPRNPKKEISTKDIFMRDSLFVNFGAGGNNTLSRNLAEMIDVNNAAFVVEDAADQYHFNYRYFFMADPSSENITRNKNTKINLVKLRYAVGHSYTRLSSNLKDTANVGNMEREEIQAALKNTIGFTNISSNWSICPEFFTYRMLPLKRGFMSANEYNRVNSRNIGQNKLSKCLGIHPPAGMEDSVNDVYVYTFVDQTGNYVTKDTPINKRIRREDNSFGPGDLPYEDGFFMFPKGFEDTVVSARFPDGVLLFSYRGFLSPIPPLGTVVLKSKLHEGVNQRSGYPDQVAHVRIANALTQAMTNIYGNIAMLDAMTVRMNRQDIPLASVGVAHVKDIIIGGIGYIAMMSAIKDIVAEESNIAFTGGRNKFMSRSRRRHNKSVKRNRMKSKSKGMTKSKGRARARAASMLKSAKQRFYKAGGGRGMDLGLGPSAPQPLQCNSPLVSQASPV